MLIGLILSLSCLFTYKGYQKHFRGGRSALSYDNFYTPDIMTELDIVVVQGEII